MLPPPPGQASHEHRFSLGEEVYSPDTDLWTKSCQECGYQISFEKM